MEKAVSLAKPIKWRCMHHSMVFQSASLFFLLRSGTYKHALTYEIYAFSSSLFDSAMFPWGVEYSSMRPLVLIKAQKQENIAGTMCMYTCICMRVCVCKGRKRDLEGLRRDGTVPVSQVDWPC